MTKEFMDFEQDAESLDVKINGNVKAWLETAAKDLQAEFRKEKPYAVVTPEIIASRILHDFVMQREPDEVENDLIN